VALQIRNWLLRQMNARDSMDGVIVTVKVAVAEFGPKQVAQRLRHLADSLERTGALPGLQLTPGESQSKLPQAARKSA
jgi:hypothetical protein